MGAFEILLLAGFIFLFLLSADHGQFTLKTLRKRLVLPKKKPAKVLRFEIPGFDLKNR